jgi:hypothetical protein
MEFGLAAGARQFRILYGFQIRHDLPDWFLTCETAKSPLGLCKVDVLVRFV